MALGVWTGQGTRGTEKMQPPQHLSYSLWMCKHTVLTAKPTQETAKIAQEQTHVPVLALRMTLYRQVQCRKQPAKHGVL